MSQAAALYRVQVGKPLIERDYSEIVKRLTEVVRDGSDPFVTIRAKELWRIVRQESRQRSGVLARRARQDEIDRKLAEIEAKYRAQGPQKLPTRSPAATGVLDKLATPSPFPPATHKLVVSGRARQLLYSETGDNLDAFIGQRVAVWGEVEPAKGRGVVVIRVSAVGRLDLPTSRPATRPATRPVTTLPAPE